jgi:hypothetical protein
VKSKQGICCKCGDPAYSSGQRFCREHHNEFMREWRKTHRLEGEARLKSNARSKLHVYIKRGKIKKQACQECGDLRVWAWIENYLEPLKAKWYCHWHHLQKQGKAGYA